VLALDLVLEVPVEVLQEALITILHQVVAELQTLAEAVVAVEITMEQELLEVLV
jgi:hypothetical protein